MSTQVVAGILNKRSPEEKRALLVHLLRELIQQSPAQAVSIEDEAGRPVGLFAPASVRLVDDVFVEGSPGFAAELQRRRLRNDLVPVEEALRRMRSGAS